MVEVLSANRRFNPTQLDPATSSQFLLNCFRLLVGPRLQTIVQDNTTESSTALEPGDTHEGIHGTVDGADPSDAAARPDTGADAPALPSHVSQQREQLSHLMLDLVQEPFAVGREWQALPWW